jgi:hypothetical protein
LRNILLFSILFIAFLTGLKSYAISGEIGREWGTFLYPFAVDSLWNSRPIGPTLGEFEIPDSTYAPRVGEGSGSVGAFEAKTTDQPVVIHGARSLGPRSSLAQDPRGVWDPDAEARRNLLIERWPTSVSPASGSDGHADIVDATDGIIHSFWKLEDANGEWRAVQYAWTALNGRGWGDPAHYFQGARATGVASIAGLIRKHEIDDGDVMYRHALAMSLPRNALSPNPTYIFPATSADHDAANVNTGEIPQGALMMLPSTFDTGALTTLALRKVAETLKFYGAYVIDRNRGTPFFIYAELGSGFNLHEGGWNNKAAKDLRKIQRSLRQVILVQGWIDANGQRFLPDKNLNRLSMRGPWKLHEGLQLGVFDTWRQAVVFPETESPIIQSNASGRSLQSISWAPIVSGKRYRLTAITEGGGKLRLEVIKKRKNQKAITLFDSGELENGQSILFTWPLEDYRVVVTAVSGIGSESSVSGALLAAE